VEYACCCRTTCDWNSWINSCVFGKESPTFEHFLQIRLISKLQKSVLQGSCHILRRFITEHLYELWYSFRQLSVLMLYMMCIFK